MPLQALSSDKQYRLFDQTLIPLQLEPASCKAQMRKQEAEIAALQEQNCEVTAELAWAIKELLRLKQQENQGRCLAWLQDSAGLSSVRAAPRDASELAEAAARANTESPTVNAGATKSTAMHGAPWHCIQ
jgi:hypothetical protein